ncbi:hypothetical protein JTB14_005168 [Gonioctena quinquepunctata]|nr:hypothetical protein JTB14_005168 [Gonioctena quinquepunctata]
MKTYQDLPISGHTGYDKTYARMKKTSICPGMSKDIKKYVDACISCAHGETSPHAKPAPLKSEGAEKLIYFNRSNEVRGSVSDGRSKSSNSGQDLREGNYSTSWDAKTSAHRPRNKFHVEDDGKSQILLIQHLKTSAYRPQTNGAPQRFHRTLRDLLSHYISPDRDWDEWLLHYPYDAFSYRLSVFPHVWQSYGLPIRWNFQTSASAI